MIDYTFIKKSLIGLFNKCTDEDKVREFAKDIIGDRNREHLKVLREKDNYFNTKERDIDPKLKKWRLKHRKP